MNVIKSVKGIGLKTAQRILVDLKDKIQELDVASNVVTPVAATANQQIASEAVAALSMLGFASTQSQKAVAKILSDEPALSVEQVIKSPVLTTLLLSSSFAK